MWTWLFGTAPTLTDADWRDAVATVPLVRALDATAQDRLRTLATRFVATTQVTGGGGLEVTPHMRAVIAVQACLLLVGTDVAEPYPELNTVVVHPSAYAAAHEEVRDGGIVRAGTVGRSGESWASGLLVLSWDDALDGAVDPDDGHNVVLHEFAHQLDTADGVADGAPVLAHRGRYAPWARVLGAAYRRLQAATRSGDPAVLRPYGATAPEEFFAVATEAFFERGRALKRHEPALYAELARFYGQDPAAWEVPGGRAG